MYYHLSVFLFYDFLKNQFLVNIARQFFLNVFVLHSSQIIFPAILNNLFIYFVCFFKYQYKYSKKSF